MHRGWGDLGFLPPCVFPYPEGRKWEGNVSHELASADWFVVAGADIGSGLVKLEGRTGNRLDPLHFFVIFQQETVPSSPSSPSQSGTWPWRARAGRKAV